MDDVSTPNSDGWWFERLRAQLVAKRPRLDMLDDRVHGRETVVAPANDDSREAWERFQKVSRGPYAGLLVNLPARAMRTIGIRTGASGDKQSDAEAWKIWQGNHLDSREPMLYRAKYGLSEAYTITGAPDPATGIPVITVEDPRQVVAESSPTNIWDVLAALKLWCEPDGTERGVLYMPTYLRRVISSDGVYEWDGEPEPYVMIKRVPVTWFPHELDILTRRTYSELDGVLDLLDQITLITQNKNVITSTQAFRLRALFGLPEKDDDGNVIDWDNILSADAAAFWRLPGKLTNPDGSTEDVHMWESGTTDITPLLTDLRHRVQDLAAAKSIPLSWIQPESQQAAAGADLARATFNAKIEDFQRQTADSWERTVSLAFEWLGDEQRASTVDMEILWAPLDKVSMTEKWNAANIALERGMPWQIVATTILGLTPQEAARTFAELTPPAPAPAPTPEPSPPAVPVAS